MTNMTSIAPVTIAVVALIGIALFALGTHKAHSGSLRKKEIKKYPERVLYPPKQGGKDRASSIDSEL